MLVGVDGCAEGWICVIDDGTRVEAVIVPTLLHLLARVASDAIVAIDVPIGLPDAEPRACDRHARRLLGRPRGSSVFPAPVRASLAATSYAQACADHARANGRKLSRQAFGILAKIREVDEVLRCNPQLQHRVREVHPEVSFAVWNGGRAMRHGKRGAEGRREREALIDAERPGLRTVLRERLRGRRCRPDDLNDAFAALWTARRIRTHEAVVLPPRPEVDRGGLRMEIVA